MLQKYRHQLCALNIEESCCYGGVGQRHRDSTGKARGFWQHLQAGCLCGTDFANKPVQMRVCWRWNDVRCKESQNQRGTADMLEVSKHPS